MAPQQNTFNEVEAIMESFPLLDVDDVDNYLSLAYLLQEESDSDNDEEEALFLLMCSALKEHRNIRVGRKRLSWNEHVSLLLHEDLFTRTYRMSYDAFNTLLELLRPSISCDLIKSKNCTPEPIYPELVMAIGLQWLAGGSYLDIKTCYGM